jgi:hypothetical protein
MNMKALTVLAGTTLAAGLQTFNTDADDDVVRLGEN